jgi:hypothetical protein
VTVTIHRSLASTPGRRSKLPCKTTVDDGPMIRRTLKIALESIGHRPFEVAFFDVRLGQERGIDLLAEIVLQRGRFSDMQIRFPEIKL